MRAAVVAPRPQLLTYPDSLGGDLRSLEQLLSGPLAGLFHGVHVLPPFPSSGDRGFAPLTYSGIDPRFGAWDDLERIAGRYDLMLDVMVNHISRKSREFQDFQQHGRRSRYAPLFITLDKIWPGGVAPADDIARIFLRKPQSPFSTIRIVDSGTEERIWTSFGTADWAEQIDLDITTLEARALITGWLRSLAEHGVRIVRLDAIGYVVKKPGTTCFMVEPEIYEFLEWITRVADSCGLAVLPEIHDRYSTHEQLASRGFWTYDFVLPGLLLHAFLRGDATMLAAHLDRSPDRQFTTLDCHDGIPVRPDLDGILEPADMVALGAHVERMGGNVNRILTASEAEVDVHQLNCTYFSALGGDEDRYLVARAIQVFAKGVPQVYYVGLLAGGNDAIAVQETGDGRAINRHDYALAEVSAALRRPVVRRVLELIRLRNTHPAFDGVLNVETNGTSLLRLSWHYERWSCSLEADLATGRIAVDTGFDGRSESMNSLGVTRRKL